MCDSRIIRLSEQLEALSYMPYQIKNILLEAANGVELAGITSEQADQVVEYLEEYIAFAQKCQKIKR